MHYRLSNSFFNSKAPEVMQDKKVRTSIKLILLNIVLEAERAKLCPGYAINLDIGNLVKGLGIGHTAINVAIKFMLKNDFIIKMVPPPDKNKKKQE